MSRQGNGAVKQPRGTDARWAEKIEMAKAAREQAQQLQARRPATASQRRTLAS